MNPKKTRFRIDPSVKRGQSQGGSAPDGHARRCQGRAKHGGQCGRWALRTRNYCAKHGGRLPLATKKMPGFYSKHVGPKLRDKLEELAKQPDSERYSLTGETDAVRLTAIQAMKVFDKVCVDGALDKDGKPNLDARATATMAMRDSMEAVADMLAKATKIDMLRADKIPIGNAKWLAERVMRMIHDLVEPKDKKLAKKLLKHIEELCILEGQIPSKNIVVNID